MPPRRPWEKQPWRLRSTWTLRSLCATTRSMKSGPGRCRTPSSKSPSDAGAGIGLIAEQRFDVGGVGLDGHGCLQGSLSLDRVLDARLPAMPKIAFVGAGSTVFTQPGRRRARPARAGGQHVRADGHRPAAGSRPRARPPRELIDGPPAAGAVRGDARPPRRRSPARTTSLPASRSAATSPRWSTSRSLSATACARRSATRSASAASARAAHDPRAAGRLPRHGVALPGRAAAALRQPDGHALLAAG